MLIKEKGPFLHAQAATIKQPVLCPETRSRSSLSLPPSFLSFFFGPTNIDFPFFPKLAIQRSYDIVWGKSSLWSRLRTGSIYTVSASEERRKKGHSCSHWSMCHEGGRKARACPARWNREGFLDKVTFDKTLKGG